MARVYFDTWHGNVHGKAEDWYTDGLIYVNVQGYNSGDAVSRPRFDKSFLLRVDDPGCITHYADSIIAMLAQTDEKRDAEGNLIPANLTLPEIDLLAAGRSAHNDG